MTTTVRDALTQRINQIGPARLDIEELVVLGEQRLRRRRLTAVASAGAVVALAIALAIGGSALNRSADHKPGPVDHPPTKPHRKLAPTRPIVYSDDVLSSRCDAAGHPLLCVGTLHVGDRAVRVDQALHTVRGWPLHLTDAGVVYAQDDGSVWFTDGGRPRRIARQTCAGTRPNGLDGLATGDAGPWAAWFDCTPAHGGDLVVFDTGSGQVVARWPVPRCPATDEGSSSAVLSDCALDTIIGEHLYIGYTDLPTYDNVRRLDVTTGKVVAATPRMYARDLGLESRALVVGDSWRTGARTTGGAFAVVGSRLVPVAFDHVTNEFVPTGERVFDVATGRPVRFRLPSGYHPVPAPTFRGSDVSGHVTSFSVFEWLDDETLALAQDSESFKGRDVLTCHLPDGRCRLAVKAGAPDAMRIVVGGGLPG